MILIVLLIFLPFIMVIAGILVFNIHMRKQITKDANPKPTIDQAYLKAEETKRDDEDLGSPYVKEKVE